MGPKCTGSLAKRASVPPVARTSLRGSLENKGKMVEPIDSVGGNPRDRGTALTVPTSVFRRLFFFFSCTERAWIDSAFGRLGAAASFLDSRVSSCRALWVLHKIRASWLSKTRALRLCETFFCLYCFVLSYIAARNPNYVVRYRAQSFSGLASGS